MPASPNALDVSFPEALFLASRPKTWAASLCPVLIGTALASGCIEIQIPVLIFTLFFSLFIQIGTNFANDYFDFIKGADSNLRNGPKRATQEGWISPSAMRIATLLAFGCAIAFAIPLMIIAGPWSLAMAALCVASGVLYTGGPKPFGYLGLGELFVFIFFGPVAVCGTYFLQTLSFESSVFIASLAPGFLSCSILIANNLRDEKSDRAANKKTLVARFGRRFGSWEYAMALTAAAIVPLAIVSLYDAPVKLLFSSLFFPLAIPLIRKAFHFRDPLELISVLQGTAFLLIVYTALFCIALWT